MIKWAWGFLVLSSWMSGLALAGEAGTRLEKHQKAVAEFLDLDFFANGQGMHLSPGLIKRYESMNPEGEADSSLMRNRWGLIFEKGNLVGLRSRKFKDLNIGVMGCVVCHSGRAAGQFIVGLGNKNIDVWRMAKDVNRIEKVWRLRPKRKSKEYKRIEKAALKFSRYLGDEDLGNLTQGLVPVSFIRGWFYRVQGLEVPKDMPKGQVKIPMLWGYGPKREVGQFCDGYGDGKEVGWAVAVELAAGQDVNVVRDYYDKAIAAEKVLEELLPPAYPFEIDEELKGRGRLLFNQACAKCHGQYFRDAEGHPMYQAPRRIPWQVVKTDFDRLAGNTPEFNSLVDSSPLEDIMRYKHTEPGYFAPRLEGIWSRFPYLHNGSVPSLADLLRAPEDRPKAFSLKESGERHRFDTQRVGLTLPKSKVEWEGLQRARRFKKRYVYDTSRVGHSNQGHDYATNWPVKEKQALIEYMKSL